MPKSKIAIPTETDAGLSSVRSGHFGHSQHFIIVELEADQIKGITGVKNIAHGAGGCMKPVGLLAENGVESLLVAGIGQGPFQRLHQQGIRVFFADLAQFPDITSTVNGFLNHQLPLLHPEQLCTNSGTCHH